MKKIIIILFFLLIFPFTFCSFAVMQAYSEDNMIKQEQGSIYPKEALYYEKLENKSVQCMLCPRKCLINSDEWGFCRARKNDRGVLYTMGYSNPCAVHVDPIEKKPFSQFLPGTTAFSIGTAGCNLRCSFCQNWEISQSKPTETLNYKLTPEDIVKLAEKTGSKSIAYTYSEPTNFYEYMLETAKLAKKAGIKNVYHSNGYINEKPLRELCKFIDAACIDLKGFSDEYYNELCGGHVAPVLNTLKVLKSEGVWLEIVNLVVPAKNDSPQMIKNMCRWVKDNLGPDVPVSFSRFTPMYRLKNLPPTPIESLKAARKQALACGLNYAYIGNVPGDPDEDTYCPYCKKKLIDRYGYYISENNVVNSCCKFCKKKIAGVWQ
jgi:pyruvate formate lyase activating enzyme